MWKEIELVAARELAALSKSKRLSANVDRLRRRLSEVYPSSITRECSCCGSDVDFSSLRFRGAIAETARAAYAIAIRDVVELLERESAPGESPRQTIERVTGYALLTEEASNGNPLHT